MVKISQKLEQKQQLSPQQVLQASLLQLNLPLLEQRILHELEINPALELIDLSSDAETEELAEEKSETEDEIDFDWEELLGEHDDFEYPKTREKQNEERDIPLVSRETFSERCLKQLQDCDVSNKDLKIAEEILGNLDGQGYLTIAPTLISDRMKVEEVDVLKVMAKIHRLDPPGLAALNIQGCLLVQAEVRDENPVAVIILRDYFDDFTNHRYEKILDSIGCTKDDLNEAMEFISRLNPSPRDDQMTVIQDIVIPDISVEERNGEFHVVVQEGFLPEVRVSRVYINMLNDHKDEKDVRSFVKKKLESATWFVDAVQQRKMTIQRVMESIINRQPKYFHSGERSLPLRSG